MRAGGNLLQVGSADAAGVYPDQDLAGPDLRDRNGLQTNVVDAAIDGGLHGRGIARSPMLLPNCVATDIVSSSVVSCQSASCRRLSLETDHRPLITDHCLLIDVPAPCTGSQPPNHCYVSVSPTMTTTWGERPRTSRNSVVANCPFSSMKRSSGGISNVASSEIAFIAANFKSPRLGHLGHGRSFHVDHVSGVLRQQLLLRRCVAYVLRRRQYPSPPARRVTGSTRSVNHFTNVADVADLQLRRDRTGHSSRNQLLRLRLFDRYFRRTMCKFLADTADGDNRIRQLEQLNAIHPRAAGSCRSAAPAPPASPRQSRPAYAA